MTEARATQSPEAEDLVRCWWRDQVLEQDYQDSMALLRGFQDRVRLSAAGLVEDLAVVVVRLNLMAGYGEGAPPESLYGVPAVRALAELRELVLEAKRSRLQRGESRFGIREGWIGHFDRMTQGHLRNATRVSTEETDFGEEQDRLRRIAGELEWLAQAFQDVGDIRVSCRCRDAARNLIEDIDNLRRWIAAAEEFDQHWLGVGGGGYERS